MQIYPCLILSQSAHYRIFPMAIGKCLPGGITPELHKATAVSGRLEGELSGGAVLG